MKGHIPSRPNNSLRNLQTQVNKNNAQARYHQCGIAATKKRLEGITSYVAPKPRVVPKISNNSSNYTHSSSSSYSSYSYSPVPESLPEEPVSLGPCPPDLLKKLNETLTRYESYKSRHTPNSNKPRLSPIEEILDELAFMQVPSVSSSSSVINDYLGRLYTIAQENSSHPEVVHKANDCFLSFLGSNPLGCFSYYIKTSPKTTYLGRLAEATSTLAKDFQTALSK